MYFIPSSTQTIGFCLVFWLLVSSLLLPMIRLFSLLILFTLTFHSSLAQSVFRVDSLPSQGLPLTKNWKWHAGDTFGWASPDFDDRHWSSIDPSQEIDQLPQIQQAGIGWLRLHINFDSTVHHKTIRILLDQQVASQVYLNGQLIGDFGNVSANPDLVKAYNPSGSSPSLGQSIYFQPGAQSNQVLAVRFAVQPGIQYRKFWGRPNPFFLIRLTQADQRSDNEEGGFLDASLLNYFKAGLFLILALLHLLFYSWYPAQKVNLWFGFYCICATSSLLLLPFTFQQMHSVNFRMNAAIGQWALFFGGQLTFLLAVYSVFEKRKGFIFYSALVAFCGFLLLYTFVVDLPVYAAMLVALPTNVEYIRLLLVGGRKRGKEYRILAIGAPAVVVCSVLFIVIPILEIDPHTKSILNQVFYNLGVLSLPVCMTLFLASKFAQTNWSLADKLVQVETLSAQMLAQEQEKQQLLASHNVSLEKEVSARTALLSQSLAELKNTQVQLVQKEKMASLGELTAGIAHEIQNPLNFVNNFSQLSVELVEDLAEERQKIQRDTVLENELLTDLSANLQKINHHGSRASGIVKSMLEHSRSSMGEKQLTNLNILTDEYLRLSYHGLRAKDKEFNCALNTQFDTTLDKIEVIPQDLGRVLLNLFNNAFYAVGERQKQGESGYQPTISVQTSQQEGQVQIQIRDNGTGIPDVVLAKIFQPFFTTKPTGEGTGLGLSLSYDIITKGHGGSLLVKSQEGAGTEFVIELPTTRAGVVQ